MMRKFTPVLIAAILFACKAFCQTDTSAYISIFQRIAKNVEAYKPDTTSPPNDKTTRIIIKLRELRGGFNINEAIEYKLSKAKQDREMTVEAFDAISAFYKTGNGKRWLDNAVIWIYRQHFTYAELKTLVKFYQTSAGKKMADDFPVIMLKSAAAAETIQKMYFPADK
jgi:hypothetical protein